MAVRYRAHGAASAHGRLVHLARSLTDRETGLRQPQAAATGGGSAAKKEWSIAIRKCTAQPPTTTCSPGRRA